MQVQDWLESSTGQCLPSTLEFRLVLEVKGNGSPWTGVERHCFIMGGLFWS